MDGLGGLTVSGIFSFFVYTHLLYSEGISYVICTCSIFFYVGSNPLTPPFWMWCSPSSASSLVAVLVLRLMNWSSFWCWIWGILKGGGSYLFVFFSSERTILAAACGFLHFSVPFFFFLCWVSAGRRTGGLG
ncbi:hypothetical protein BZA05DRAFT_246389 [Tricharina praecox]|uniref:uncharacterized protein n=1 Tax=Tricharina praecox TaxID=43433 RepID=UPI00221E4406|nr:uncharacterized protein BZA05DRAFT_246389 [Tricharina praecox]KAI5854631.1 hypothetical protein BZA05DRAFT_246389 [Tricharina praecox]